MNPGAHTRMVVQLHWTCGERAWRKQPVAQPSHQVMGARGTTLEHPVSTETKRL
jgi:hypothetical protein